MNDELARLEDERTRLIEIAQSDERRTRITTSITMFVAIGTIGIISVLLIGAVIVGQLSLMGLFGSALAAGLFFFILSRKLRSGNREATVSDVVFRGVAHSAESPIRMQIEKHDKRIASLKTSKPS